MNNQYVRVDGLSQSELETNKVLRNTYLLLSMTLLFSAATAGIAMVMNAPPMNPFLMLIIYMGLIYFVHSTAETPMGIVAVFALTGLLGYTLGPMLNMVTHTFSNGSELVMTSLAGTGIIFFALSGYVLTTKRDMSYLGGFLVVGSVFAMIAAIASMFFHTPALSLAVSGAFMLISSGMIMFETSQIIQGGQRNYILATVSLYVSLYNLFVSLLSILSSFSGNRD